MRRRIVDYVAYARVPKESYERLRDRIKTLDVPGYGEICYIIAAPWIPLERLPLTIIYCHGRDETIPLMESEIQMYANYFCANVVCFDYFGYGETVGRPSEASTNAAMLALLHSIKKTSPDDKIIAWGRSIGSCAACYIIDAIDLCVVESGLSSAARTVFSTNKLFCLDGFNNMDRIAQGTTPTIIIHGTDDEVVPYRCSVENYTTAVAVRFPGKCSEVMFHSASQNQYIQCGNMAHLSVFGRGHNDMNSNDAAKVILYQLRDFISEHLAIDLSRCRIQNINTKRPREPGQKTASRMFVE